MDSFSRTLAIGTPCMVAVLIIMFPGMSFVILLVALIGILVCLKLGLRNVSDPQRPIIYRLGQMQRLGPSGLFFALPILDKIVGELVDMRPISLDFTISQIAAADGDAVYMNLELTWQLRPDIQYIDALVKQTLLKTPAQRQKMIEHTVSVVARQLLLNYTSTHLGRADMRESITDILRSAVNELMVPHGMMLDTIFWRGSTPSDDYIKNKLAMKIAHERVEAIINDVQMVQERLPNVRPEEFLTQQAYIDLLRRGITPPLLPGQMGPMGQVMLPGLPYMPPPPPKK